MTHNCRDIIVKKISISLLVVQQVKGEVSLQARLTSPAWHASTDLTQLEHY